MITWSAYTVERILPANDGSYIFPHFRKKMITSSTYHFLLSMSTDETKALAIETAPYTKIVGIEMDYEMFKDIASCIKFLKTDDELDELQTRRNFKLTVGSRSHHLREGPAKCFRFYDGLARAMNLTTYRPSRYVVVIKQLGKDRWPLNEMPPPSEQQLEKEAKEKILRAERDEKRRVRKQENEVKRKEKQARQKALYARIRAQVLAEEGVHEKPSKKRKQVILEIPRYLLNV
jgi:hypothetical protein